jgi:hypothetical protein
MHATCMSQHCMHARYLLHPACEGTWKLLASQTYYIQNRGAPYMLDLFQELICLPVSIPTPMESLSSKDCMCVSLFFVI